MLRIEDYPSSVDNFHGLKWYLVIKEFFSSARFHKVLVISAFWRIVWNGRVSRMAHELPSFSLCSSARVAVEKGWRVGCNPSLSLVILYRFVADWYCHLGFSPVFLWSFFPLLLFQKFGHFEFCPQADILGLIF